MITWSLLWLLFEVGQEVEAIYENTGERVSAARKQNETWFLSDNAGENEQMAMRVDGWAYGMSQKGRTFDLHGYAYQWTGVKIQRIRITRKVLEFSVRGIINSSTNMEY